MKALLSTKLAILLLLTWLLSFISFCNSNDSNNANKIEKDNIHSSVMASSVTCPANWFPHSQTPAPPEGNGSPFDKSSTTNLIFHEWSWQKFLWLTKPMKNGKALFEDSTQLVSNQLLPIGPQKGASLVLSDTGQAGSNMTLISNAHLSANGKTYPVYYGIYANDIMMKFADSIKQLIFKDTGQLDNRFTFPVGSLELKSSWIEASAIPANQLGNYYVTTAFISPLKDTFRVAMLGMHVTGVVKNHPEFIWATFEHNNLAPDYDWTNTTASSDVLVTSVNDLLLFPKGNSATIKDIQPIPGNPPPTPGVENLFTVFQVSVPRTIGNKFMPDASQSDASNKSNYDNITGLNSCVAANVNDLWKNYKYNGSVWFDTDGLTPDQQIDSMITASKNFLYGSAITGAFTRGALAGFNITMESFYQALTDKDSTGFINFHGMSSSNVINCMFCHTPKASPKVNGIKFNKKLSPLYDSHIFRSFLSVPTPTHRMLHARTGTLNSAQVKNIEIMRINELIDALKERDEMIKRNKKQ